MSPMIFFNIGWMKRYEGISDDDRPEGGGKWVDDNAWDYSMLNFKPINGRCYGYGETGSKQVNLSRVGATPEQDRLDGVIVVWVSNSPGHGPVIVGWYKNATLFRDYQEPPEDSGREHDGTPIGFYATATADDCILLPEESRTFPIPRGEGGMGQSNVWYADQLEHEGFKERVEEYIAANGQHVPEGLPKSWIFQANPRLYDIDAALVRLKQMTWTVSAHKSEIRAGDEVFLWRSGPEAGIIALATVLSAPKVMGGEEEGLEFARDPVRFNSPQVRVRLRLDEVISPALSKDFLKTDSRLRQLSILKFSQGTNFVVTPAEAKVLHEVLENRSPNPAREVPDALSEDDEVDEITAAEAEVGGAAFRVWVYSPGPNARYWEEFYRDGIMAIGGDQIGDFRQYPDVESTAQAIIRAYGLQHQPINDARAYFDFAHEMRPGDKIIVKKGFYGVIGFGTVIGDYEHVSSRAQYKNVRRVRWERRGNWKTDRRMFPVKALTEFTEYRAEVEYLYQLLGLTQEAEKPAPPVGPPYTVDDALRGIAFDRATFMTMLATWKEKKNLILKGPPGVGKTFLARRMAYALIGHEVPSRVGFVQFHQSYSYEDFIQGYRPTAGGFDRKDGVFVRFCKRASLDQDATYVFIIDEINRSNLSKVFGELLMLVEADKRGSQHSLALTYSASDEEQFYVPPNVYVLGMMNTADRSLAMVDYALRRRFAFVDLKPLFGTAAFSNFLVDRGADAAFVQGASARLDDLNQAIVADQNLGAGFAVGHSYFCTDGAALNPDVYSRTVEHQIIPLLEEYWFDDPDQVKKWSSKLLASFDV